MGHPAFSQQGAPLGESFIPHLVGGIHHLKGFLFSPYPAIPPYVVKAPHPGTTDDREHITSDNERPVAPPRASWIYTCVFEHRFFTSGNHARKLVSSEKHKQQLTTCFRRNQGLMTGWRQRKERDDSAERRQRRAKKEERRVSCDQRRSYPDVTMSRLWQCVGFRGSRPEYVHTRRTYFDAVGTRPRQCGKFLRNQQKSLTHTTESCWCCHDSSSTMCEMP